MRDRLEKKIETDYDRAKAYAKKVRKERKIPVKFTASSGKVKIIKRADGAFNVVTFGPQYTPKPKKDKKEDADAQTQS